MLLISASILSSSQIHVLFLPCSTGVLLEFFLSHLVLSRSRYYLPHPFNQSVVSTFQVLFILSSLASLFN